MDDSKENQHVHFKIENSLLGKDNEITVEKKGDIINVHLGFLQLNHQYEIDVRIPKSICEFPNEGQVVPVSSLPENPHLKVITASNSEDKLRFKIELLAHKERLMVEEFCFGLSGSQDIFRVALHARVLGKGKGTPLLKKEIHIIHGPKDEEDSDASSDI